MGVDVRVIAVSAGLAVAVAGGLATPAFLPQAFADEPQHKLVQTAKELFPAPFDFSRLKKFDITLDDSVSTEVSRTQIVKKIGYGQRTTVAIVTTPSGTYSTDAITSPYVRYPGIDVAPKHRGHGRFGFSSFSSTYGTAHWTSYTSGSFTYYSYSVTR